MFSYGTTPSCFLFLFANAFPINITPLLNNSVIQSNILLLSPVFGVFALSSLDAVVLDDLFSLSVVSFFAVLAALISNSVLHSPSVYATVNVCLPTDNVSRYSFFKFTIVEPETAVYLSASIFVPSTFTPVNLENSPFARKARFLSLLFVHLPFAPSRNL